MAFERLYKQVDSFWRTAQVVSETQNMTKQVPPNAIPIIQNLVKTILGATRVQGNNVSSYWKDQRCYVAGKPFQAYIVDLENIANDLSLFAEKQKLAQDR